MESKGVLGRSARARSLARCVFLSFSFSFFPPFLLLHPLSLLLSSHFFAHPLGSLNVVGGKERTREYEKEKERERERERRVNNQQTKTKRWSRFQNGNKTTQWSQDHQRGQSKKGAKRRFLETRLRGQGETASRINSVVLEISSTNQRSGPVAQPI